LADLLRAGYLALIALSVAAALLLLPEAHPPWRDLSGRIVAAAASQIVALALLRQLIPKPLPGIHRIGPNVGYLRWLVSSVLAEVALRGVVRAPFWFFHGTRCWYLRALGADLALRVTIPPDVVVREPAMLSVASGAQLEGGVKIENTAFGEGRITVGAITIGEGSLIGAHAILMPGSAVAHEARIGTGALIGAEARVGFGASIGAGAKIGERAEIGSYAVIGAGVVVGDGAHIGERSRVTPGASVPAGTEVGDRQQWPVLRGDPAPLGRGASTRVFVEGGGEAPAEGTEDPVHKEQPQ
jgi:acetyltransferase-like isoleucine patch superfamily enzyme